MRNGYSPDPDTLTAHWTGRPRSRFVQPDLSKRIKEEAGPVVTYRLTPAEIARRYPDAPCESKLARLKRLGG